MNIGIYIYDEAEVLDFSGPFEVFTTASRLANTAFTPFLFSETGGVVRARGGYLVQAHYSFLNCPPLDLLLVVGGVHSAELHKPNVLQKLAHLAQNAQLVASVCTGAFILAEAGVLTTQKVTTHWEDVVDLRRDYPQLKVIEGVRWVDEGRFLTSGGISAGIDLSLHLVGRLHSIALAERTARQMEFAWRSENR